MQQLHTRRLLTYLLLFVLTVVATLSFFAFWQKLIIDPYSFLTGGGETWTALLLLALSATFFLAFTTLINLLVRERNWRYSLFLLLSLTALPFFGASSPDRTALLVLGASWAFFALALLYFSFSSHKLLQEHLKINFSHVFGPRLSFLVTVLGLIFALNYHTAAVLKLDQFKLQIPDFVFEASFNLTQSLFKDFLPQLPQVRGQTTFKCQSLPADFYQNFPGGQIPPEARAMIEPNLPAGVAWADFESILRVCAENSQEEVELSGESLQGVPPGLPGGLGDLKAQTEEMMTQLLEPLKKYVPLFFTVLAFFLFRSVVGLAEMAALVLVRFLIKILLVLGWVRIKKETVEAQRLEVVE